jgi:hypothetical protein
MASVESTRDDVLTSEVDLLNKLDHPNILKIHEVMDTKTKMFIFLELVRDGDLYDKLKREGQSVCSGGRRKRKAWGEVAGCWWPGGMTSTDILTCTAKRVGSQQSQFTTPSRGRSSVMRSSHGRIHHTTPTHHHTGRISEDDAREIFIQMADAIAYLHRENVSHRDLKPENILVQENPTTGAVEIKISDFGLSRTTQTNKAMETMAGTLDYCAPEIINHFHNGNGYGREVRHRVAGGGEGLWGWRRGDRGGGVSGDRGDGGGGFHLLWTEDTGVVDSGNIGARLRTVDHDLIVTTIVILTASASASPLSPRLHHLVVIVMNDSRVSRFGGTSAGRHVESRRHFVHHGKRRGPVRSGVRQRRLAGLHHKCAWAQHSRDAFAVDDGSRPHGGRGRFGEHLSFPADTLSPWSVLVRRQYLIRSFCRSCACACRPSSSSPRTASATCPRRARTSSTTCW